MCFTLFWLASYEYVYLVQKNKIEKKTPLKRRTCPGKRNHFLTLSNLISDHLETFSLWVIFQFNRKHLPSFLTLQSWTVARVTNTLTLLGVCGCSCACMRVWVCARVCCTSLIISVASLSARAKLLEQWAAVWLLTCRSQALDDLQFHFFLKPLFSLWIDWIILPLTG